MSLNFRGDMEVVMEPESMETKVKTFKSIIGAGVFEGDILEALPRTHEATSFILDSPSPFSLTQKTLTPTGGTRISSLRVSLSNNLEDGVNGISEGKSLYGLNIVKQERKEGVKVKEECDLGFLNGDVSGEEMKDLSGKKLLGLVGMGNPGLGDKKQDINMDVGLNESVQVKEECDVGFPINNVLGDEKWDIDMDVRLNESVKVKEECDVCFMKGEVLGDEKRDINMDAGLSESVKVKEERDLGFMNCEVEKRDIDMDVRLSESVKVKEECDVFFMKGEILGDEKRDINMDVGLRGM
ncbi:hypothetical protein OROGR_008737 [Orobanche gracilis]